MSLLPHPVRSAYLNNLLIETVQAPEHSSGATGGGRTRSGPEDRSHFGLQPTRSRAAERIDTREEDDPLAACQAPVDHASAHSRCGGLGSLDQSVLAGCDPETCEMRAVVARPMDPSWHPPTTPQADHPGCDGRHSTEGPSDYRRGGRWGFRRFGGLVGRDRFGQVDDGLQVLVHHRQLQKIDDSDHTSGTDDRNAADVVAGHQPLHL